MIRASSSLFVLLVAACASTPAPTPATAPAPVAVPTAAPTAPPTPTVTPTPSAAAAADAEPEVVFAIRFLPGPKWLAGKGAMAQPGITEHIADMDSWHERKLLAFGGPYLDSSGGMAVVRVKTMEEAKRLADDDPGVKSGLLVPEIHPWLLAYGPND